MNIAHLALDVAFENVQKLLTIALFNWNCWRGCYKKQPYEVLPKSLLRIFLELHYFSLCFKNLVFFVNIFPFLICLQIHLESELSKWTESSKIHLFSKLSIAFFILFYLISFFQTNLCIGKVGIQNFTSFFSLNYYYIRI